MRVGIPVFSLNIFPKPWVSQQAAAFDSQSPQLSRLHGMPLSGLIDMYKNYMWKKKFMPLVQVLAALADDDTLELKAAPAMAAEET